MRCFCKTRKEVQLASEIQARTSCTLVQGHKRLRTYIQKTQKGHACDELAKPVMDVYLVQKHPILNGCINFQKGELQSGGENMHFSASDPSLKMMMGLIN